MTQQASVSDSFTFVGGLNTEGGYFVTPENSWKEGQNMVPQKDGSLERRPAVVLEDNYSSITSLLKTLATTNKVAIERWDNVGNNGSLSWFVIQVGVQIYFYEAFAGTTSIRAVSGSVNGAAMQPLTFDMTPYLGLGLTGSPVDYISIAPVFGNLIITQRLCDPIFVEWQEGNTLTVRAISLKVRDFVGLISPRKDGDELTQTEWENISFWPQALYNLYNQGWYDTQLNAYKTANSSKLPANTKQWIYGKNADDDFDAAVLAKVDFGTGPAPKGRFILDAFYMDRAVALTQLTDINTGTVTTPVDPGQPEFDWEAQNEYWEWNKP